MEAFAENPESFANVVTELKGSRARRSRIGGFRVIFEETDTEFVVTAMGGAVPYTTDEVTMNDSIRYVTTPSEELAILPRAQLEELLDVAGHASAMADYRSGRVEALTTSEMRELMKAPTPLAFWRRRRGKRPWRVSPKRRSRTSPNSRAASEAGRSTSWRGSDER